MPPQPVFPNYREISSERAIYPQIKIVFYVFFYSEIQIDYTMKLYMNIDIIILHAL